MLITLSSSWGHAQLDFEDKKVTESDSKQVECEFDREHKIAIENKEKNFNDHFNSLLLLIPNRVIESNQNNRMKLLKTYTTDYRESYDCSSDRYKMAIKMANPTLNGKVKSEVSKWRKTCITHNMTVYSPVGTMREKRIKI
jgi:hypothetical protein